MEYELTYQGEKLTGNAERSGDELAITSTNGKLTYKVTDLGGGRYLLSRNSKFYRLTTIKSDSKVFVLTENSTYTYGLPSGKDSDSFGGGTDDDSDKSKVSAPMPGKVIKLLVKEGDTVEPKQKLLIVEAMKMENPVVAPFKAEVIKINCTEGELVDSDTLLIELNELS